MEFVEVCSMQDMIPVTSRAVRISSTDIALFNVEGTVHAVENSCLHNGAALSGGKMCGKIVSCPAHGWRFDVSTGALVVAPEYKIRTFPVKIIDGKVMVQVQT